MSLLQRIKIMVVDDMSVSRGLITQSLEEIGFENIDFDKSGSSAFPRISASPVHLVISDFNMPGMNGLDFLEKLRTNAPTRNVGFILVTGSPSQEMLARGQKLGLNNLVKKPFTTPGLKKAIEAVVGRL